jgi:hypothetical protein
MHLSMKKKISYLLLATGIHCNPSNSGISSAPESSAAAGLESNSALQNSTNSHSTMPPAPTYLNPLAASVTLDPTVNIIASPLFSKALVPTLSMTFQGSDYAQILRCSSTYAFTTQSGIPIANIDRTSANRQSLQWAWLQAWNNSNSCEIANQMSNALSYPDIAAPSGNFYYVVNPCISAANSSTGQEACSYMLQVSNIFQYTNTFQQQVQQKLVDLANAQSALSGYLAQVQFLSFQLSLQIQYCENYAAEKNALAAIRGGLVTIGIFAGISVLGAGLGFGAAGTFMFAQMGALIGTQMLQQFAGIGQNKGNWCTLPYASRSEDNFNIFDTQQQLTLLNNVTIPNQQQAAVNLLNEVSQLDNSIISYNQVLTKMSEAGINLNNLQSVVSAVNSIASTGILPGTTTAIPNANGSPYSSNNTTNSLILTGTNTSLLTNVNTSNTTH